MFEQTVQTAAEAFTRYQTAYDNGLLIQSTWHMEVEGRHLACGLGVLGDNINSPSKCPAQVMPRWLAQMTVYFFDGQPFEDAKAWGLKFYAELRRLNGMVPFSVVHDWQANIVGPLAIEVATKRKRNVEAHMALQAMQLRALIGEKISADEWRPVLRAAFYDAYVNADADADAYAYAYAYANANANANANAYANADANAYANADAYAYANADADADAAKQAAVKRLADGMVECLAQVPTPTL